MVSLRGGQKDKKVAQVITGKMLRMTRFLKRSKEKKTTKKKQEKVSQDKRQ